MTRPIPLAFVASEVTEIRLSVAAVFVIVTMMWAR